MTIAVTAPRASEGAGRTRAPRLRVAELDGLRFLAAFAVVLYHYTYRLDIPDVGTNVFPVLGRATMHGAMNLFFVISGFVILVAARDRTASDFVVSRIVRLYPEFWIGVVVSAIAFTIAGTYQPTIVQVLANLTMIPHLLGFDYVDGVYWTLFVELKFYVLIWLLCATRQLRRIETWLYVWLAVTAICFLPVAPHSLRSVAIYPYSPLFIAGGFFYLVRTSSMTPARASALLMCLLLATFQTVLDMPKFVRSVDITPVTMWERRLVVVAVFAVFTLISLRRGPEVRLAPLLAFVGALTYPLYLLHNVGKHLILVPLARLHPVGALVLAVTAVLFLAWVVDQFVARHVRKPLQTRLRTLLRPPGRSAPAPVAASATTEAPTALNA